MHNLRSKFDKILQVVNDTLKNMLDSSGNRAKPGPRPQFSDAEVIALSLLAESLMFESEHYFFKLLHNNYKHQFPNLIHRSRFNRRRRQLMPLIEKLREHLQQQLIEHEDTFLIDSMPVPIVRFSRAKRARICKEDPDNAPAFGYCSAQRQPYYGYKPHLTTTVNGVITHFAITKASVHDIHYFNSIAPHYSGCTLLGDRAYLNDTQQLSLFEESRLLLITPKRRNQKNYRPYPALFRRVRKRIETTFSQFWDQFRIQKNYAKSSWGFASRILTKITAFTMLQYLNKFTLNNQLNHVKHALI